MKIKFFLNKNSLDIFKSTGVLHGAASRNATGYYIEAEVDTNEYDVECSDSGWLKATKKKYAARAYFW